ncbi:glycolipid transfer protein domain-containing protein [Chytridium lagenaria]|nr:glycolipid transfer protein domain-containing protein [Chytridium lagenaria]
MAELYFTGVKPFNLVSEGQNIDTATFLDACEGIVGIFDKLGSALGVIKSDVSGNVGKIRAKFLTNPVAYGTLQEIVLSERAEKKWVVTEPMLWLKRALEFTAIGLRHNIQNPADELSVSFNVAYGKTLSPFHSFLVRPIFSMAMKACPTRKDFYAKLGASDPTFDQAFNGWLGGLENNLTVLVPFFEQQGLAKGMS